jgi:hypothetical protein
VVETFFGRSCAGVDGIQGPFAGRLWQMLCPRTYKNTRRLTGSPARFPYVKERATQPSVEKGEWRQRRKLLCNTDHLFLAILMPRQSILVES